MILSGKDLKMYIQAGRLTVEPLYEEQYQQNGIDLILKQVQHKAENRFYLGCTEETLAMPNDLMAFVQLRSTWARRGFFLPPTIVDAGFEGNITLEILAFMESPIVAVGQRFAHLIFARTSSACEPYTGKYQHQEGITGPR